jgi:Tfp pilus assembly protein PilE
MQYKAEHPERAFTLVELFVVLGVITILAAMVLPALAATHDRGNRAACQYRLRQIGVVATQYAADNDDTFFAVPSGVVNALVLSASIGPTVGLSTNGITANGATNIWTCPNRPGLPVFEAGSTPAQWVIGYQYFGGISNWVTSYGSFTSRSPVKLSQSKPYWALASDTLIKFGATTWAGQAFLPSDPRFVVYTNVPPHTTGGGILQGGVPQGGNEVFCDGSVQWVDLEKMYFLTQWNGAYGTTRVCWYQDPSDFGSSLQILLPMLGANP